MGGSFMGGDLNELLAYSTGKIAWIRDKWLGIFYYSLVALVVLWVVFGQIFWHNEDFIHKDVHGVARMWVSHPTLGQCDPVFPSCKSNYKSLLELPYCNEYAGDGKHPESRSCKYMGKNSIAPLGEVVEQLFIPTAMEMITERKSCEPSPSNGYLCENEYEELPGSDCGPKGYRCQTRGNKTGQYFYVADVESFWIQFTSSYDRKGIQGTSLEHRGFYYECEGGQDLRPGVRSWTQRLADDAGQGGSCPTKFLRRQLPCKPGIDCYEDNERVWIPMPVASPEELREIGDLASGAVTEQNAQLARDRPRALRHRSGTAVAKPQRQAGGAVSFSDGLFTRAGPGARSPTAYQESSGDMFQLGRLLKLAGVSSLDDLRNPDGWTGRQSGTVLEVNIEYNNLYRIVSNLGFREVEYTYRVREMPMPYVSRQVLSVVQPADYPLTRSYEVHHGVLVIFTVGGEFGIFSLTFLLLMLATAFALISSANAITDFVAMYVHPRRANYFHLKYEVSPDFSNLWRCEVCGFYNHANDGQCQGRQRWQGREHDVCGAAQPAKGQAGGAPA